MQHQDLINRLRHELTHIVTQTEGNSAMGLTDHNIIAENLICGLMREIFGLRGLRNLNGLEKKNYPAIDLADFDNRVAVQVTATPNLQRVRSAIGKFLRHDLDQSFDRLIIYILSRKQGSYSQAAIDKTAEDRIVVNAKTDILDYRDLLERAMHIEPAQLVAALRVIEAYNRGVPVGLAEEDFDPGEETEEVTLNLVQLFFPRTLYVADIVPDYLTRPQGFGSGRLKTPRDLLRYCGRERGLTLPSDYYVHANQLLTFHHLDDERNPFSWAVDAGTVVPLTPEEFYGSDDAEERVFKALLRYSLQEKLYRKRVQWQHEQKQFVFMPLTDDDLHREIRWQGLKRSERLVYERKLSKKDADRVYIQKHLAFGVDFYRFGDRWYMSLTPDWYFSYGHDFRSSRFAAENVSWLKRRENNGTVEKHFRFLVSWLRELDAEDLFSEHSGARPNVSIGDAVVLPGHPMLPDDEWLPVRVPDDDDHGMPDFFSGSEDGA